jgi:hypothetical protein
VQTPARIIALVAGSLAATLAVVLLLAGGGVLWAVDSNTTGDGYFETATHGYATPTVALATEDLDLDNGAPGWIFDSGRLARLRVRARAERDVFIGVGPREAVDEYLAGVAHDELTDLDVDPFEVRYRRLEGERRPAAPTSQRFWVASATGGRALEWPVRKGRWSVVVMNVDASPGVSVAATVAVKVPFLHHLGLGLMIAGGVLALLGGGLLALTAFSRSRASIPA